MSQLNWCDVMMDAVYSCISFWLQIVRKKKKKTFVRLIAWEIKAEPDRPIGENSICPPTELFNELKRSIDGCLRDETNHPPLHVCHRGLFNRTDPDDTVFGRIVFIIQSPVNFEKAFAFLQHLYEATKCTPPDFVMMTCNYLIAMLCWWRWLLNSSQITWWYIFAQLFKRC